MQLADLYQKALNFEFLTIEEGMFLFEHAPHRAHARSRRTPQNSGAPW